MAATVEAARLTELHRLAQLRLGAQTVARMRVLWRLLDPTNLDGTFDAWVQAALPVVGAQRISSARLAANYMTTFKMLELGVGASPPPAILAEQISAKAATTSLLVTGPLSMKRNATRAFPLARATGIAEAASSAAAMRHVLDGGRDTIRAMTSADRQARGWARVTSGRACKFCSMLAGRGAVYSGETVQFRSHDGCGCVAEPVYRA